MVSNDNSTTSERLSQIFAPAIKYNGTLAYYARNVMKPFAADDTISESESVGFFHFRDELINFN